MIREVFQAQYFAICADEAADSSNKEQLPLVDRFVDNTCAIMEEFIEFIVCDEGVSGFLCPKKSCLILIPFVFVILMHPYNYTLFPAPS